jgi:hypothetical protein
MEAQQEVFTCAEAADFARVAPGKIDQWLGSGLKHFRTGSQSEKGGPAGIIILRKHLLAWIESNADNVKAAGKAEPRKRGRPKVESTKSPTGKSWIS